jgi:hypothetical protein
MMGRAVLIFAMLLCAGMLSGPAAAADWIKAPYRIGKTEPAPDMSAGSLVLLPFTFRNEYKPTRSIDNFTLHFKRLDNGRGDYFDFYPGSGPFKDRRYFLGLVWLAPGKYKVDRVSGFGSASTTGPHVNFTMDLQFEVLNPGEVIYLGRSNLVNIVKRSRDDQGSGFPTPMLEQILWGFGDGTLDVSVDDKADEDWHLYTAHFPSLKQWQLRTQLPTHYRLDRAVTSQQASIDVLARSSLPVPRTTYTPAADVSRITSDDLPVAKVAAVPSEVQMDRAASPSIVVPEVAATAAASPSNVTAAPSSWFGKRHTRRVPPPSGFAAADSLEAVPVRAEGKDRYRHYLTLPSPKAFVVYETGGWRFWYSQADAMVEALNYCAREGRRCWLYAVDNHVVWQEKLDQRIGRADQLQNTP